MSGLDIPKYLEPAEETPENMYPEIFNGDWLTEEEWDIFLGEDDEIDDLLRELEQYYKMEEDVPF